MNELAKIETITAVEVFEGNKMGPLLERIEKEVRSFVPNIETAKGRKEIASVSYKVSQSKTVLDKLGKNLIAEAQAKVKSVNSERKKMRDRLDFLRDETRKPLTEYEDAEAKRADEIEKRIADITALSLSTDDSGNLFDSSILKSKLQQIKEIVIDESFGERVNAAALAKENAMIAVDGNIARRKQEEEDKAELERLKKEAIEREQKERDEKIAREAEIKVKQEAEEAARKERERVEREKERLKKEKAEAEEREAAVKLEAERAAKEAEEKRLEDIKAEKDRAAKEKAEAEERRLADIKAEQEKAEAERAELLSKQEEKERIERERIAEEKRIEKERQADEDHRRVINNNILSALTSIGVDANIGKKIVSAIALGQIPHVSIKY